MGITKKKIINFLKDFKMVSELISGEKYVTLSGAIIAVNCLLDKIEKQCFVLDEKASRNYIDEHLIKVFTKGRDKLVKHCTKCNWICCVSLILDPRVKSDGLDETDWCREMKEEIIKTLKQLYKHYYQDHQDSKEMKDNKPAPKKPKINETENSLDFDVLFLKDDSLASEKELNSYLTSRRADSI